MKKAPKRTPAAGTVTSIARQAVRIVPPDEWQLHSAKYGFMKTSDGENLVSLIDVVKWLMQAREVHRSGALRIMLDALQPEALAWLYLVRRDEDPSLYLSLKNSPWAQFDPDVPLRLRDAQRRGAADPELERWFAQPEAQRDLVLAKESIEAETRYWHEHEAELAEKDRISSFAAILMHRAHSLWGYGTRIEGSSQPAGVTNEDEWSGTRLQLLFGRFKVEGVRDPNKRAAEISGLDEREVRRRRAAARSRDVIAAMASSMTGKRAGERV